MGRLGLLVETWRRGHAPEFLSPDTDTGVFVSYGALAIADPKAPMELKVMGPFLWTAQVTAVTTGLYLLDPLRLREGGFDDVWYSGWNPLFTFPAKAWEEIKSWEPERPHWAGW